MKPILSSTLLAVSLAATPVLHGAILINSVGTYGYSQNFDGLDVSSDVATAGTSAPIAWSWTNDSTYTGWTRQVAINTTTNRQDKDFIGEFTNGTIRFGNMGSSTTNSTDRALGVLMQGLVGAGNSVSFGVIFQVGSGLEVTSATVGYNGEQWFQAADQTPNDRLDFQYKILSSYNSATFLINDETGWTNADLLDFEALKEGSNDKLDGNVGANRSALSDTLGLNATDGQFIAFRWNYLSDSTAAQAGLGVDDFNISFTTVAIPEPSSALLALLGSIFLLRRSRS